MPEEDSTKNKPINFRSYFEAEEDFLSDAKGSTTEVEKELFTSLREELSTIIGKEMGMSIDPADLIGYGLYKKRTVSNRERQ